ncbi:TrmH family RNA methyltransferase [Alteromonas gilva]|uniref:TrmH family RNA methyltransferase n=1 Tax=Alteromonas gilva TaxID=2987522 RepID=A0ABT5L262_9ALTE|nr:TrmH family RNA methyltransferase [Alteromonas gilva]MDC8830957.1 TrmH family RNA methyltransferase [Alteromonas gilva]
MVYSAVTIGLQNPKSATNVASILRAAGCFGVSSVFYTGQRFGYAKEFNADTKSFHRVIPTIGVERLDTVIPQGAVVVGVELVEGAIPLPEFTHPDNAYYLFGPEDGSLAPDLVRRCDAVVYIPTFNSLNLAATANILLYDRLAKGQYDRSDAFIRQSRDNNNGLRLD